MGPERCWGQGLCFKLGTPRINREKQFLFISLNTIIYEREIILSLFMSIKSPSSNSKCDKFVRFLSRDDSLRLAKKGLFDSSLPSSLAEGGRKGKGMDHVISSLFYLSQRMAPGSIDQFGCQMEMVMQCNV